ANHGEESGKTDDVNKLRPGRNHKTWVQPQALALVLFGLAIVASGQYGAQQGAPQYGASQQGAPGSLFSFSNQVNHASPQPSAGPSAGLGAPAAPSYAAPQPQAASYGSPPPSPSAAPQRSYALPSFEQLGAHNPAGVSGFANLGQVAQQNPAFNIPVPQGYEQPAGASARGFPAAPAPVAASYRAAPQYSAPQYAAPQSYATPQGAPAGNPYGGPFSFSNSVTHSAPQAAAGAAAGAAPAAPGRY
ncbi:hypothetical protein BIW11_07032, partial [Tropilaelaps mercedesae]